MKLIIQIPAFNEEKTIAATLADLPKKIDGIDSIETLVIDDGSSDGTVEAARRAGADHVVRLLSHRGLATAFVAGIDAALRLGADVIVNTDADNQYRAADIPKLIRPIIAGTAEVVIGDRDIRNSPYMGPWKKFLQRFGSWAVGVASGVKVPDVTSGLRAFSREAAFQINVFNPFTYTLETIIQAGNRNLRIQHVKIGTNPPTRQSRLYRGIGSYVRKSVITIFRIYTLYKPLKTFFFIGAFLFLAGVGAALPFLWDYFTVGTTGHIQSLILAAILMIAGFQTILIGLVTDLISVNRRLNEEILIRLKKLGMTQREPKRERERARGRKAAAKTEEPKPLDTQWIWLVDETKLDERTAPAGGEETEAGARKRRKRRRTGARHFSEPKQRRHESEHAGEEPLRPSGEES